MTKYMCVYSNINYMIFSLLQMLKYLTFYNVLPYASAQVTQDLPSRSYPSITPIVVAGQKDVV